jgi:fructokinase
MQVWSIGEVLWDIFPDGERFGGAALNFCANLQRLGDSAILLSAVGNDARGQRALERMAQLHLSTRFLRVVDDRPTGVAIVSQTPDGEPSFVIPRPSAFDSLSLDREAIQDALQHGVDWIYFGTLLQTAGEVERFTTDLIHQLAQSRCFYDMNLRTGHWNLPLVQRLSGMASVLKLNESEAEVLYAQTLPQDGEFTLEKFCRAWAATYDIDVICVTLGGAGCLVYDHGEVHAVPGFSVTLCDTVGAGDAFAAGFLHGYHRGWPIVETARFANALGALVASRAGATPEWTIEECLALLGTDPRNSQTGA